MACHLAAASHHLIQYRNVVHCTPGNKPQWNLNRNLCIFIQENASENVVWKMAVFLSRAQCVFNKINIFFIPRWCCVPHSANYYNDVIMGATVSQISSLAIIYWTAYSGADQRKHKSSASLAFVRGIHRGPVISPHKWPVTGEMFPLDDVIMVYAQTVRMSVNGKLSTIKIQDA